MRVRRLAKRIVLALLGLVALGVIAVLVGAVVAVKTAWGRDKVRQLVEAKLDEIFVGGATVGDVEGSPFGDVVIHDVTINGPDGKPAFVIGTMWGHVELAPLLDHEVVIEHVSIDRAVLAMHHDPERNMLNVAQMTRPGRASPWLVRLPAVEIHRGAIVYDAGEGHESVHLDDAIVDLAIDVPEPEHANIRVAVDAHWRERGAPVDAIATVLHDEHQTLVPLLAGQVGGVGLAAALVDVVPDRWGGTPGVGGLFAASAPRKALAALGVKSPLDGAASANVTRGDRLGEVRAAIRGVVDRSPVRADVVADMATKHARGSLHFTGVDAAVAAPDKASGLLTGDIAFELAGAAGAPTLALRGHVRGKAVRYGTAKIDALSLDIDAASLPAHPRGHARLELRGVDRGRVELDSLVVTASNHADDIIDVSVRTSPRFHPWLFDADARVAIGHGAKPTTIELVRHHLRISKFDWHGTNGVIEIGAGGRIAVHDLKSESLIGSVALDGSYERGRIQVEAHADVMRMGTAKASIDIAGDTVRRADVSVDADLAKLAHAFGVREPMAGHVNATAKVSGPNAIALDVAVHVGAAGAFLAEPIDVHATGELDAKGARGDVTITAITDTAKRVDLLALHAELPVPLARLLAGPKAAMAAPLAGSIELPSTQAHQLLAALGRSDIVAGTIDGKVTLAGTLAHPTATAHVAAHDLEVPASRATVTRPITRDLALDATYDGAAAKATLVAHAADGGELHVALDAPVHAPATGTLRIDAKHFEVRPLAAFAPGAASGVTGKLDGSVSVTGLTAKTAKLSGKLAMSNARVPLAPNLGTLRDGTIEVGVDNGEATFSVAGKVRRGTIRATGTVPLAGNRGHAKIELRHVSPIAAVEPVIDADVVADLQRAADRWTINLKVEHGVVTIPDERGHPLDPVGLPEDFTIGPPPSRPLKPPPPSPKAKISPPGPQSIAKNVAPKAPPPKAPPPHPTVVATIDLGSTRVIASDIRGVMTGKLVLSFGTPSDTTARVGITGHIEAQRGDLQLFGHRYQVDHASAQFDGSSDPILDARITTDFPDVSTSTQLRGRLSKPELELRSNPPTYTQDELLSFLLGGEPNGDPMQSQSSTSQVAGAGTTIVAQKLSGYFRKTLPISLDVLNYESATATNSAALRVGTWITRELMIAYRRHLDSRPDENASEGDIEYWLAPHVSLTGTAGDRGYDGLDLLWRHRW